MAGDSNRAFRHPHTTATLQTRRRPSAASLVLGSIAAALWCSQGTIKNVTVLVSPFKRRRNCGREGLWWCSHGYLVYKEQLKYKPTLFWVLLARRPSLRMCESFAFKLLSLRHAQPSWLELSYQYCSIAMISSSSGCEPLPAPVADSGLHCLQEAGFSEAHLGETSLLGENSKV